MRRFAWMRRASITSLSHLHEEAWSDVKGAEVKVKQVTHHVGVPTERHGIDTRTESIRTGTIVGRAEGTGLTNTETGTMVAYGFGPCIYIETPEETVLELRTDKDENELLDYTTASE